MIVHTVQTVIITTTKTIIIILIIIILLILILLIIIIECLVLHSLDKNASNEARHVETVSVLDQLKAG